MSVQNIQVIKHAQLERRSHAQTTIKRHILLREKQTNVLYSLCW